MSVISSDELGWVLDHQHFWNKSIQIEKVQDTRNNVGAECETLCSKEMTLSSSSHKQFHVKPELFLIYQPFRMDSHYDKIIQDDLSDASQVQPSKSQLKRQARRKRKYEKLMKNLTLAHEEALIKPALEAMVCLGRAHDHFKDPQHLPRNNNTMARETAEIDQDNMATEVPNIYHHINCGKGVLQDGQSFSFPDLCNRLYSYKLTTPGIISCGSSSQFLIPPRSSFYMSHTDHLQCFVDSLEGKKFDLIVIDPPWENKSVKRKKRYFTLPSWELKDLPVVELCNQNCLVAVWLTNKERNQSFVRNVLFPNWSVKFLAHWYWIKVTIGGVPVTDLITDGKKPYESLILGRFSADTPTCTPSCKLQTEGTPSCKLQTEGTPSCKLQTEGTPSCELQTEGTPSCELQTEGTPSCKPQTEGTPSCKLQTEGTPSCERQTEGTPSCERQTEGTPSCERQTEGTPSCEHQTDSTLSHESQNDGTPSHELQTDGTPSCELQADGTPSCGLQTEGTPSCELQTKGTPSCELQTKGTPSCELQTEDTPSCELQTDGTPSYESQNDGAPLHEPETNGTLSHGHQSNDNPSCQSQYKMQCNEPQSEKVLVSVPCVLHSKKPPLEEEATLRLQHCGSALAIYADPARRNIKYAKGFLTFYDILKPYYKSGGEGLELFARNLQPGWTSWGNEVLKHQDLCFYDAG